MAFYRRITSIINASSQKTVSFTEAEQTLQWQKKQADLGNFIYEEDGFTYTFKDGSLKIKWSDIDRIAGYKADLTIIDEIHMDIRWNGQQITFTEETPGWYQLLTRLKANFPAIPDNWEDNLMQPPIATNYAVLYQREASV